MNQANYSIEEDVFGTCLNIKVDISLYSLAAIMKSTYWFTDKCFLYSIYIGLMKKSKYLLFLLEEKMI